MRASLNFRMTANDRTTLRRKLSKYPYSHARMVKDTESVDSEPFAKLRNVVTCREWERAPFRHLVESLRALRLHGNVGNARRSTRLPHNHSMPVRRRQLQVFDSLSFRIC